MLFSQAMRLKYFIPTTVSYFLILVILLVCRYNGFPQGEYVLKPLLMVILGAYYWVNARNPLSIFSKMILVALAFSWLGDCLLMFQWGGELFFILGLAAFLLAHIAYCTAFFNTNRPQKRSDLTKHPWLGLPCLVYGFGFVWYIKDSLGDMLIPVSIYALTISTMVIFSIYRYGKVPYISFGQVFIGAVLFVFSDSMIALNKFYVAIPYAAVWIMLTYALAQYLIVIGALKQVEREKKVLARRMRKRH